MSDHKPQSTEDMTQHIITSDGVAQASRRKPMHLPHMSKVMVATLVIVIAGLLGYGGYSLMHKPDQPATKPATVKSSREFVDEMSSQLEQAGNSAAALKAAEEKLAQLEMQTAKTADKEVYALASANLYRQANQLGPALTQAQKAEATYKTALSAATLAEVYRAQGNYAAAAKYYGLAAGRSPKTAPTERSAYNDYRLMQEEMETHL